MKKTISLILVMMLALSSVGALADLEATKSVKVSFVVQGNFEWSIPIDFDDMRYVFDEGDIEDEDTKFENKEIGNWPDTTQKPEKWPEDAENISADFAIWNIKVGASKQVDVYMKSQNDYTLVYTGEEVLDPKPTIGYQLYYGEVGHEEEVYYSVKTNITYDKNTVEDVIFLETFVTGQDLDGENVVPVERSFRYRNTEPYPTKLGTYKDTITFYAKVNPKSGD